MGNRCSHQQINPNIRVGRPTLSTRVANNVEVNQIDTAIAALKKAKSTDTESIMLGNVTEAYRLCREIFRSRSC